MQIVYMQMFVSVYGNFAGRLFENLKASEYQ